MTVLLQMYSILITFSILLRLMLLLTNHLSLFYKWHQWERQFNQPSPPLVRPASISHHFTIPFSSLCNWPMRISSSVMYLFALRGLSVNLSVKYYMELIFIPTFKMILFTFLEAASTVIFLGTSFFRSCILYLHMNVSHQNQQWMRNLGINLELDFTFISKKLWKFGEAASCLKLYPKKIKY